MANEKITFLDSCKYIYLVACLNHFQNSIVTLFIVHIHNMSLLNMRGMAIFTPLEYDVYVIFSSSFKVKFRRGL